MYRCANKNAKAVILDRLRRPSIVLRQLWRSLIGQARAEPPAPEAAQRTTSAGNQPDFRQTMRDRLA